MQGLPDLKALANEKLRALRHDCLCGAARQPKSERQGAFAVTICQKCGGLTTPLKEN